MYVEVRTDLVPGFEVVAARTSLHRGADTGPPLEMHGAGLTEGDDALAGVRVAELSGLPPGTYTLTVELLRPAGTVAARRRVAVDLRRDRSVTVLLTRDCGAVACPGSGDDPAATECLGGRCVRPSCTSEQPEGCGEPECTTDGACPAGAPCASAACVEGICVLRARPGECAASEWCHPDDGCTPRPGEDGGAPDAGPFDAGAPDAGCADLVLSIATNMDDGEVELAGPPEWLPNGEGGDVYVGYWGGAAGGDTWGYFRFAIPGGLPAGATVLDARLSLHAVSAMEGVFDPATDALVVSLEDAGDAAQVDAADQHPGASRTLVAAEVRWPDAGGLMLSVGARNPTPDLSPLFDALLATRAVPPGGSVQLWIRGENQTDDREVAVWDSNRGEANAAELSLTVCP